jgi:farnesyl-diphosphate farnesyltransferase
MSTNNKTKDDIDWCFDILEDVSRTFSVPINMIENERSKEVCLGYLVCRISDTIEDDPDLSIEDKNELFELYSNVIKTKSESSIKKFLDAASDCMPSDPEEDKHWELLINTDRLFNAYCELNDETQECIDKPALEMIDGMKNYCNKYPSGMRLKSVQELDNYCYYVAGTVGNMLTNITSKHNDIEDKSELRSNAQKYGLLLQLVNIIKDVNVDYNDENNIYVPENLTDRFGIEQEDIIKEQYIDESESIVNILVNHAEDNILNAREYLSQLSDKQNANVRTWSIPYLLAVATLRE